MGEITVDPKGVLKLLNGLKVHKAPGPDGLSARVLKECSSEVAPILAYIYNESLAQGNVPDDWRQANVAPVFKKGEKYDPANYRPVSLTCICCKTLEHIIVSNINKHLSLENILADCQHGFRSQRSCETQLVQFFHDMVSNLDRAQNRGHRQTDVIIMDFAKAFDKVLHRRLLYKLHYYGIRGSTHQWIASWLSERFQKVVLDGQASDPVPVLSGVPQGSVLGPVLFLIFINDLADNIRSSVRLFAYNCVLYRNIKTLTDCQILQDDLNSLGQWETDWQIKFNVAKCHSMRVTRHLPSNQIHFNFSPHTLELLLLTTWNGVNMFLKFLLKQLRLWVFFGSIWLLHLSIRRKLHTKHWFALSSSMQLLFGIPIMKLRRKRWRKCRRQQLGGSAGDGIIKVATMACLMILTGHPWRTAGLSLP